VSQPRCADGLWDQAAAGGVQRIPLCHQWYVEAKAAEGTPPLHVVVLGLSSDGTSYALAPNDGARLAGVHRFDDQTLVAGPPVDVFEQILAIASPQPLDANRILTDGEAALAGATYTVSALTYQVVANDAFLRADEVTGREYTVHNFDIRPYLPDDQGTALARFLLKADGLAKASAADGYSYKQHEWKKPTDAENLALGIDCSRSIWFAFTRSGLRYNRRDEYLATVGMLPSSTAMADQFDACSTEGDYRLGDVLVYRSDERGDGHVVVVIDPEKRIAWGSHGWDGTPRDEPALKADTGVEYQKIKVKTDWMKWDRSDMQLKACWRYREFAREQATGRGAAGTAILNERCGC